MWIMIVLSLKIKTDPLFNEILVKFPYLVGIITGRIFYDTYMLYVFLSYGFGYGLRLKAEVFQGQTFGYGRRWKLFLRSNTANNYLMTWICMISNFWIWSLLQISLGLFWTLLKITPTSALLCFTMPKHCQSKNIARGNWFKSDRNRAL